MRSDQHAAGAEEAVVGEPAQYPRVLRDRSRAAERFGRARERLQVLGGGTVNGVGMRRHQRHCFRVLGPDEKLKRAAVPLPVLVVPIRMAFHQLAREATGNVGDGARQFGLPGGEREDGVGRLGGCR